MAYLDPRQRTQEDENTPQTVAGGAATAAAAVPDGTQGQTETTGTPLDFGRVVEQNDKRDFTALLSPLQAQAGKVRAGMDTSWTDFQSKAGPDDPWDHTETTVLDRAISSGQGIEDARGILGRTYAGPTDLDRSSWGSDFLDLQGKVQGFQSPDGIAAALAGVQPGATQGQRRFDALLASRDPDFQASVTGLGRDVGAINTDAETRTKQARETAQSRSAQAHDVAGKARGYLDDTRGGISNAVANQLSQAQSEYSRPVSNPSLSSIGVRDDLAGTLKNWGVDFNNAYVTNPGVAPTREAVTTGDQANRYNNVGAILQDNDRINSGGSWSRPGSAFSDAVRAQIDRIMNTTDGDGVNRRDYWDRARATGFTGNFGNGEHGNWLLSGNPAGWTRPDVTTAVQNGYNYADWWNQHGKFGR